jgi:tetratricopeptide (TPR) repeat protein
VEVASGNVSDRPFARTFYTVAARRFTGDMILTDKGKSYKASWEDGYVVAAKSPSAADSAARVAVTSGLVDSSLIAQVIEKSKQNPAKSQLDIIEEMARLSREQVLWLKRRILAAAASRLFGLPEATFVLNNARSMRAEVGVHPLDARWLIYYGVNTHYTDARLKREMQAVLGRTFKISAAGAGALPAFGFNDAEKAAVNMMQSFVGIQQMINEVPDLDRHAAMSIVYSLMACDCTEVGDVSNVQAPAPTEEARARPKMSVEATERARRRAERARKGAAQRETKQTPAANAVRKLIAERLVLVEKKANHFRVLGLTKDAMPSQIRTKYFALAKRLHPDRITAAGATDVAENGQRVFAAINQAFAILSNPKEAQKYRSMLDAGGVEQVKKAEAEAEEMAIKILRAEEHFVKGDMALKRGHWSVAESEFKQALELNAEEAEHYAYHAFAWWKNAADKKSIAKAVTKQIAKAIAMNRECIAAWYFRGVVARERGHNDNAIECLNSVLDMDPDHRDAQKELRLLQSRAGTKGGGGLFGR